MNTAAVDKRLEIAEVLQRTQNPFEGVHVVTGFDGFVDEMITLVDQRHNIQNFDPVETISKFGSMITQAAGQSSLREIVITSCDAGGCSVNMGDGLASLDVTTHTFATVGVPMHAAFSDYAKKAELISWGNDPGRTLAFEFADGKLMFSSVSPLADFTPAHIETCLLDGIFKARCEIAQVIALTDWTLYPHMTACWEFLQERIFSQLKHRPEFFIDLVDPSSRCEKDIVEMLNVLPKFEAWGDAHLGLNQNEANIIGRLSGLKCPSHAGIESAAEQASALQTCLGLNTVVIHGRSYAVSAGPEGVNATSGPLCAKPLKSTGAGDRFNAGYAAARLLGLDAKGVLLLACATSGLYVRLGRSPSRNELADFLVRWEKIQDNEF